MKKMSRGILLVRLVSARGRVSEVPFQHEAES